MTGHDILSGMGAFLGTAAAAFVVYVKNHNSKNEKRISRELDRDQRIYELITRAMIELNAKRVYVSILQHYTKEPLSGTKSRTHEICADGVSYQASQYQNILLSTVPEELELVLQPGASFTLVDKLADGRFKWLCKSGDVAAVARATIWRDGEPKAFVGADFSTTIKPERIDRLCEYAGRIEMILFS